MKKCNHSIKNLTIVEEYDSSPDGYGGTSQWTWYELQCKRCSHSFKLNYKSSNLDNPRIRQEDYKGFTCRNLDVNEIVKIINNNHSLFKFLVLDNDLKDAALRLNGNRSDKLDKNINKKRKLIQKHIEQYVKMLKQHNGGVEPTVYLVDF